MTWLLDTCVLSDFARGEAGTLRRLKSASPAEIAVSAVTVMEVEYGLARVPARAGKLARRGIPASVTAVPSGVDGNAVVVVPATPRTYDAVRLRVTAARTAELSVFLVPDGQSDAGQRVPIPLGRLLTEPYTSILDERGNRLLVRRDPGDELQVRFDRDSLVFNAGETFDFRVVPNLVNGVEADDPLVCTVRLQPARGDDKLWEESRDARVGPDGKPPEIGPFSLTLPGQEGVYDLHFTLGKRRLPTRFAPAKDLCQRIVQLVVVQPQPAPPAGASWQVVADSQPQEWFGQRAVQVLVELQADGVTGRVGQCENGQFKAPRRDEIVEPAPFEEPLHRGERVAKDPLAMATGIDHRKAQLRLVPRQFLDVEVGPRQTVRDDGEMLGELPQVEGQANRRIIDAHQP